MKQHQPTQKPAVRLSVRHASILIALAVIGCQSPRAANAQTSGPLSLQDCIGYALDHNITVRTTQYDVSAAVSRLDSAKSGYYPQVSVQNTTFTVNSGNGMNQQTTGTTVSVSQNLYDGGLREARVDGARGAVTASAAAQVRAKQSVIYNVSKAYYNLLRAHHLAEVAKANVNYNQGLLNQVRTRADVGDAATVDTLPVEAQLASSKVNLISALNAVRTAAVQLQSQMGYPLRGDFEIQHNETTPTIQTTTLDQYRQTAISARPDLKGNRAQIDSARANVRTAKIALYPRPSISAGYDRQVTGGSNASDSRIVGAIVFSAFDGGANRAAYREARTAQASAEAQEQQARQDVYTDVEQAFLEMSNAQQRMSASVVSLAAATKNYQVQQERYAQGVATTLDLLNAEVQVVTAQSDDVQARYDYFIACAQMNYAIGK